MLKIIRERDKLQKTLFISLILHAIILIVLIRISFDEYMETLERNHLQSVIRSMKVEFDPELKNLSYKHKKINKEQSENQPERCIKKELIENKLIKQKYQEYPNKEHSQIQELSKIKIKERDPVKIEAQPSKIENLQIGNTKVNINDHSNYLNSNKSVLKDIDRTEEKNLSPAEKSTTYNRAMPFDTNNIKDINTYAGRIKEAIERFFYDSSSYTGQTCRIRIKIAPNGMLLDVKSERGDHELCAMALAAARQAKFPQPPSQEVYNIFQNTSLDFKP